MESGGNYGDTDDENRNDDGEATGIYTQYVYHWNMTGYVGLNSKDPKQDNVWYKGDPEGVTDRANQSYRYGR